MTKVNIRTVSMEQRITTVFNAICVFKLENDGCAPTRQELIAITGIHKTSLSSIIKILCRRGMIRFIGVRSQAGKIEIIGATWMPPEGWEAPIDYAKQEEERLRFAASLEKAIAEGTACECKEDVAKWQKAVRFPRVFVMLMCDDCKKTEVFMYGIKGIRPFAVEESPLVSDL